jgi:uncharacterized membrane protein
MKLTNSDSQFFIVMKFFFSYISKKNKLYFFLTWIVIFFGFLFRFTDLDKIGLWSDELFTVSAALDVGVGKGWLDFSPKVIQELIFKDSFITWKAADNTPPLFDLMLIIWAKCFGYSDFSLRSLPAFLGSISPFVFFYGLRKNIGDSPAFLGAAMLAFSPSAIAYSQEVRSYTLSLLLCTMATARIVNHVLQDGSVKKSSVWSSSVWPDVSIFVLMAYSHYTGLFMAGLLAGIYVFFVAIPQKKYSDILKFLIVPLAISPWFWLSRKAFIFSSSGGYAWREYHSSEIISLMIPGMLNFFLVNNGVILLSIWVIIFVSSITGYEKDRRWIFTILDLKTRITDRRILLAIFLILAISLLFFYGAYNAFTSKMWHPRYFLVAFPVLFCSFALLFSASRLGRPFSLIFGFIIIALSLMGVFNYFNKEVSYKEEYREASAYISENMKENSVILLGWIANEAYYRHYLDKDLSKFENKYFLDAVSTLNDVKQACILNYKKGRHFFIFQHQDQSPYFEELGRCAGIKKISKKKFRGILVEEYTF